MRLAGGAFWPRPLRVVAMQLGSGPNPVKRATQTLVPLAAIAALSGCGSGGDETASAPTTVPGVAFATAGAIKGGIPRQAVERRLGQPVLTSRPAGTATGGCSYYAMKGRPLADVWQFCFNARDRVNEGATQYSSVEPAPPPETSAARAALLGRGDAVCQGEVADLAQPLKRLGDAISEWRKHPSRANRIAAAHLFGDFHRVVARTNGDLGAFRAPPDESAELARYLDARTSQAAVLLGARAALAAGDTSRYAALVDRFNALAKTAKAHAAAYGFATCAAPTFS